MNKEELKKIISQIKKYNLTKEFESVEKFEEWLKKLSTKQINNFNSLNVLPTEIKFPVRLLINDNLLNCDDYNKRITAMCKLKNGEGCWHLFDALCSSNFLNSKKYYQDIEMISKAPTAKYALWIINKDSFINSKYHDEDLKLIVEAKDYGKEETDANDWLVAEALAMVAENVDSINSLYHQQDMELIAKSGSECLQMTGAYPERGLNKLAINKVSLNDKYHLENMQILSNNHISNKLLYNLMTNKEIVKGKYYREEINTLKNAKSKVTALAIYYYIVNPYKIDYFEYREQLYNYDLDFNEIDLLNRNSERVRGNLNPNYLEYLKILNQIDNRFVLYFESLLSNETLINSPYQQYDLDLLLTITNKDIYMDLYKIMSNKNSLSGPFHKEDVELISKTSNKQVRQLLLEKATNKDSINSVNHKYDMRYIRKLNLDNISEECYKNMRYYLFNPTGLNDKDHIGILEKLYRGKVIETKDPVEIYLDNLEKEISGSYKNSKGIVKILQKSKNLFKNK